MATTPSRPMLIHATPCTHSTSTSTSTSRCNMAGRTDEVFPAQGPPVSTTMGTCLRSIVLTELLQTQRRWHCMRGYVCAFRELRSPRASAHACEVLHSTNNSSE